MSQRGRRPGPGNARQDLLDATRDLIAEQGVDRTSIRQVAERAGVDPALVYRFFRNKADLVETMVVETAQPEVVMASLDAHPGHEGEALLRGFLAAWSQPAFRAAVLGLLRSSTTNPTARDSLREMVQTRILGRLGERLAPAEAKLRAGLIATQIAGLAMGRYVLQIEPLNSLTDAEIIAYVSPTIQRYIDGPL